MGEEGTQTQATERLGLHAIRGTLKKGGSYDKISSWSSPLRATAGIGLWLIALRGSINRPRR